MRSTRALLILLCVALLGLGSASAALATDEEPPAETTTTADPDAPPDPNAPPVSVTPEVEEAEDLPWTAKFMAPGMAVLAILIFIGVIVWYFVRIRGRYEVVG